MTQIFLAIILDKIRISQASFLFLVQNLLSCKIFCQITISCKILWRFLFHEKFIVNLLLRARKTVNLLFRAWFTVNWLCCIILIIDLLSRATQRLKIADTSKIIWLIQLTSCLIIYEDSPQIITTTTTTRTKIQWNLTTWPLVCQTGWEDNACYSNKKVHSSHLLVYHEFIKISTDLKLSKMTHFCVKT